MDTKKLAQELLAWFDERDIHDISAQENVGEQKNLTAFFFPVEEEGGYPSYEIIATIAEDVHPFSTLIIAIFQKTRMPTRCSVISMS